VLPGRAASAAGAPGSAPGADLGHAAELAASGDMSPLARLYSIGGGGGGGALGGESVGPAGAGAGAVGDAGESAALVQVLRGLEAKLSGEIAAMQRALREDKPLLQAAIERLGRRQADVEWKLQRARPEWMGNPRAAAFFNDNLFALQSPFLTAAAIKRPATAAPAAPEAPGVPPPALAAPPAAPARARPASSATGVACQNFESPETRLALQSGREVRIQGSAAAARIFRRNAPEARAAVEVPASLEHLFAEDAAADAPRARRAEPLPNTVPRTMMAPGGTSDATHPWQMPPSAASAPPPKPQADSPLGAAEGGGGGGVEEGGEEGAATRGETVPHGALTPMARELPPEAE